MLKNHVESYIYTMREKLNGSLTEFVSKNDLEMFSKQLTEAADWLYGEGEEATKSVYVGKLNSLKALGDPIENRKQEYDSRYTTLDSVRKTISTLKLSATSAEPKYDHIDSSEKKKIISECEELEKFLSDKIQQQEKLSKTSDPIITTTQMLSKKTELERNANTILNKPKPAPPPKADEKSKSDEKKEESKKKGESDNGKPNGKQTEEQQTGGDNKDIPMEEKAAPKSSDSTGKKNSTEMDLD